MNGSAETQRARYILTAIILCMSLGLYAQSVAINTDGSAADASAILDIKSIDKGVLIPRMDSTQRKNISAPADGLLVFDTDTKSVWYYASGSWDELKTDSDWFVEQTNVVSKDMYDDIYHMGNVGIGKDSADYPLDVTGYDQATAVIRNSYPSTSVNNPAYGILIEVDTAFGSGWHRGSHANINHRGIGAAVGYSSQITGDSAASVHGALHFMRHYGTGKAYGMTSSVTAFGSGSAYGGNHGVFAQGPGSIYGTFQTVAGTGSGNRYGTYTNMYGSGNNDLYGSYQNMTLSGDGDHHGAQHVISGGGNGNRTGTYNRLLTFTGDPMSGTVFGTHNFISSAGDGDRHGVLNTITSNGTGTMYGVRNNLTLGSGTLYGSYQNITSNSNGLHYGSVNLLDGSGNGNHYGSYDSLSGGGLGIHYGAYHTLSGAGTGDQYGSFQSISNSSNGDHYGSYNKVSGSGAGTRYGIYNSVTSIGSGSHFGTFNFVSGGGSGSRIGTYNVVPDGGTSTHYAGYFSAPGTGNFAAVFDHGNVVVNQSGGSYDFRVESDFNQNQFFVDGSTGNVGIGTSLPSDDFVVTGTDNTNAITFDNGKVRLRHHYDFITSDRDFMHILIDANDDQTNAVFALFKDSTSSIGSTPVVKFGLENQQSWFNGGGNFGFGNTNPVFPLHMGSGAHVTAGGVWTSASDRSKKKEIGNLTYGLREVLKMQPRSYRYIADDSKSVGFVAQEMERIIPEVVTGEDGEKGIAYGLLTAVLVNAMQEQQHEINDLKQIVAKQSELIETLIAQRNNDSGSQ